MNSMDAQHLLLEIAATSSRNAKEDLLRAKINDPLVQQVVKAAYDPFITFGITPPKVKTKGALTFDETSPQPWIMLHQLSKRELTGNAAKIAVERMLNDLEPASSDLLWRMLSKDLRCGITEKTINQVLPGTVPAFDLMLSKPYEEKRIKIYPVAVEPKLDGFRGMNLITGGVSKAFSRTGNHMPALDWTGPFVAAMVEKAHARAQEMMATGAVIYEHFYAWLGGDAGPSCAIDGEAVAGSFNQTSGDLRRGDAQATDAILNVFDAVPYAFMRDTTQIEWKVSLRVRRKFAEFIVACAPEGAPVRMTDFRLANSHEEIQAIYAEHRAAGLEGAMVKPLDASYVRKKGHLWMKIKAEETADLRITGWFEGKAGTKLEGKFGGFIVTREHNGQPVEVRVGGGFSDAQRERFHKDVTDPAFTNFDPIGHLIEVEFHEVTPDGSLRHPRFVRFRDDKDDKLKIAA